MDSDRVELVPHEEHENNQENTDWIDFPSDEDEMVFVDREEFANGDDIVEDHDNMKEENDQAQVRHDDKIDDGTAGGEDEGKSEEVPATDRKDKTDEVNTASNDEAKPEAENAFKITIDVPEISRHLNLLFDSCVTLSLLRQTHDEAHRHLNGLQLFVLLTCFAGRINPAEKRFRLIVFVLGLLQCAFTFIPDVKRSHPLAAQVLIPMIGLAFVGTTREIVKRYQDPEGRDSDIDRPLTPRDVMFALPFLLRIHALAYFKLLDMGFSEVLVHTVFLGLLLVGAASAAAFWHRRIRIHFTETIVCMYTLTVSILMVAVKLLNCDEDTVTMAFYIGLSILCLAHLLRIVETCGPDRLIPSCFLAGIIYAFYADQSARIVHNPSVYPLVSAGILLLSLSTYAIESAYAKPAPGRRRDLWTVPAGLVTVLAGPAGAPVSAVFVFGSVLAFRCVKERFLKAEFEAASAKVKVLWRDVADEVRFFFDCVRQAIEALVDQ